MPIHDVKEWLWGNEKRGAADTGAKRGEDLVSIVTARVFQNLGCANGRRFKIVVDLTRC